MFVYCYIKDDIADEDDDSVTKFLTWTTVPMTKRSQYTGEKSYREVRKTFRVCF